MTFHADPRYAKQLQYTDTKSQIYPVTKNPPSTLWRPAKHGEQVMQCKGITLRLSVLATYHYNPNTWDWNTWGTANYGTLWITPVRLHDHLALVNTLAEASPTNLSTGTLLSLISTETTKLHFPEPQPVPIRVTKRQSISRPYLLFKRPLGIVNTCLADTPICAADIDDGQLTLVHLSHRMSSPSQGNVQYFELERLYTFIL